MSGGKVQSYRMPCLRALDPALRRGRLLAARSYAVGTQPRHGILGGFWDHGTVVRGHMGEAR